MEEQRYVITDVDSFELRDIFDNKMSLGNLVMFYSILMSFSSPLKNIIDNDLSIGQAKIALKRMLGVFIEKPDRGLLDNLIGTQIEFKNLDFLLVYSAGVSGVSGVSSVSVFVPSVFVSLSEPVSLLIISLTFSWVNCVSTNSSTYL